MTMLGFSDEFRQKCFVDEGIIYHDYDNMVFQKSFWFDGFDFESSEPYEIQGITKYLNLIFAGIPTGWIMSINNILSEDNNYLDMSKNYFQSPLLNLIDREREYYFTKQAKIFRSKTAITFTYIAQQKNLKKLSRSFISSNKQNMTENSFDIALEDFKNQLNQYTKLLNRGLRLKPMAEDETISYLNYLITGKWIKFKLPKKTYIELKFLLGEEYIGGLEPQVGDKHLRVVAIDNYFPDDGEPLMLEPLKSLGFAMRWNTRFFFLTKLAAQKNISFLSDLHEQNITGVQGAIKAQTGHDSRRYNRGAEYLFEEAEEALASSMVSNINHGKYACNIVLFHEDENVVKERANIVKTMLEEMGYKARDERLNIEEAFLSTIDGDIEHNERRSLISTENLAELMPLSGFWHGLDYHPSAQYPEQSNSMFMVDCNNYHSFKGNLHDSDLGHTLLIGKSSTGKSTLVNFLIASHMRYQNAQVFGIDNKRSMMPLCYGVNGEHYDLGFDNTAFQPLADIDTVSGYDFAVDWLETLCEINNVIVNVDISRAIRGALNSLTVLDVKYRTMENLLLHARPLSEQLADVISLYVGEETLQARVFAANNDRVNLSNYNVFEMNELINKGEKALIPALKYIFYKIMKSLDGRPTLIVIEEADTLWNSPTFAKKLDEWLKTLRKMNVYIIMVTLNVQSIADSPIRNTLLTQCATILYTPNPDLKKSEVFDSYKKFGLSDKQIQLICEAKPRQEYYISNSAGNRLFNLDMNYFEIARAFFARTSKSDINIAKHMKEQFKDEFANAWLKESGIDIEIR
ncbi:MAG: hypothetical protein ACK5Z5_05665 [Neisseriaceae bacterium]